MVEIWESREWVEQSERIWWSYVKYLGVELVSGVEVVSAEMRARAMWEAERVIVSHDTSEDPKLNYGNRKALELWEARSDQLIGMPSRKTAEPMHRDERAKMLAETGTNGYFKGYQGIRISLTGRRFFIENATIWNLVDKAGDAAGQAATFSEWEFLED